MWFIGPFYTTKGPGEGSGLGLAQVYGIIKQHDGHIAVESDPGKGTAIRFCLPAYQGEAEVALIYEKDDKEGVERDTLLVVEEDYNTRTEISETLRSHNFSVLSAGA